MTCPHVWGLSLVGSIFVRAVQGSLSVVDTGAWCGCLGSVELLCPVSLHPCSRAISSRASRSLTGPRLDS